MAAVMGAKKQRQSKNDFNEDGTYIDAYRTITEGIDEAILLPPKDLKVKWANKKIYELSGMDKDEVIGNHCCVVTHNKRRTLQMPHNICPITGALSIGKVTTENLRSL